jgi:hypothetical protein
MRHRILSGKPLLAAAFAVGVAWSAIASAQGAAKTLSAADRAGIEALLARYARALQSCSSKEYSELFIPDGVFKSDDFRSKKHFELYGKSNTLVGRATLVELVETEPFCMDPKEREARVARAASGGNAGGNAAPLPANAVIEATPGGARGTIPLGGRGGGRYEDVYVKTAEGWRFQSRSVFMGQPSPTAAGAPAAPTR